MCQPDGEANIAVSEIRRNDPESLEISRRASVSLIQASVLFAAVLVITKAVLLGVPQSLGWIVTLAVVSFRDLLFALAAGMVGEGAAFVVSRQPALVRAIRRAFIGFLTLCVAYSVVSVGVFEYFLRPLSYELLRLASDATAMRSSIGERITIGLVIALISAPVGYLAVVARSGRWHRATMIAALGAAAVWLAIGWWQTPSELRKLKFTHLVQNPHVELVSSIIGGLTNMRRVEFPKDFPPQDTFEFRPSRERGAARKNGFQSPAGVARPRNVIVIVLESVGTKYLELYGSPYETMPNLTAESAHALVFDNFYAQASYTYFSFRAINFSIYPGLPWCYAPWGGRRLPPSLASVMRKRGWRTAYLHNGDLDWGEERWLLQADGFKDAEGYAELRCPRLTSWGTEDRCLFERLIQWIDAGRGQPFMAICWTDQTHDPYRVGPGVAATDFLRGGKAKVPLAGDLSHYLNVLHETDRQLGRLFEALRERGLADDTLIVVTGDHGEAFRDPHDQRGHGLTVYEEEVNVPLMLWNPRLFAKGRRMSALGAHVDLNPSIADVLGIEPSDDWQGYSMFDPHRPSHAFFLTDVGEYLFGVREGRWKYIFDATGGPEMLFDLDRDREEQRNVAQSQPEQCRQLRLKIAGWVSFEDRYLRGLAALGIPSETKGHEFH